MDPKVVENGLNLPVFFSESKFGDGSKILVQTHRDITTEKKKFGPAAPSRTILEP